MAGLEDLRSMFFQSVKSPVAKHVGSESKHLPTDVLTVPTWSPVRSPFDCAQGERVGRIRMEVSRDPNRL